jgi:putative SOS response-associated peptidase YedK
MCYSAQIENQYSKYLRYVGHDNAIGRDDFVRKYWERQETGALKIPKAIDAWFANPKTDEEREIAQMIRDYDARQMAKYEQEIFKQRRRLADAERKLLTKTTKNALVDQRVSKDKVEQALAKIADIKRTELMSRDSRIYPGIYAPVIVSENGQRAIKLMRYQCRPEGKPAFYDKKFNGSYNARRDNLTSTFWRELFGYRHGVMIVNAFYENVETEEKGKHVLEFKPQGKDELYVACLWSHWQEGESVLDSFAAITDEPPAEIAAAGHDRVIVSLKPENIDAWLNPDPHNLDAQYAILQDPVRAYYEHRMAA